jgi:two-component system sensor histidine kinase RegB
MGLGLFIAKTLLERTGASLSFANGAALFADPDAQAGTQSGAIVDLIWPIAVLRTDRGTALGKNTPIT